MIKRKITVIVSTIACVIAFIWGLTTKSSGISFLCMAVLSLVNGFIQLNGYRADREKGDLRRVILLFFVTAVAVVVGCVSLLVD